MQSTAKYTQPEVVSKYLNVPSSAPSRVRVDSTVLPFAIPADDSRPRSLLAWWHLCSLDAPTVASLWTFFVADAFHVALPWTSIAGMFLAVWMLYAADRLLDSRTHNKADRLEERHNFHAKHQTPFLAAIAMASILLAFILPRLMHRELVLFSSLGALLFGYFFLIHLSPRGAADTGEQRRLPKELAVGLFFPAATFIPVVARAPELRMTLLPSALLLALVCTLNCLYLYAWEHPMDRSGAHWTTQLAISNLTAVNFGGLCACAIVAGTSHWLGGESMCAVSCAVSLAILLMLHLLRDQISALNLRASADAALLTPLFFLPLLSASGR